MTLKVIRRLETLRAAIDETRSDEICCASGWPEYIEEVEKALPQLMAALKAGQAMRAPIILGLQSDRETVVYDMDGWAFVKAVQAWDAATKGDI